MPLRRQQNLAYDLLGGNGVDAPAHLVNIDKPGHPEFLGGDAELHPAGRAGHFVSVEVLEPHSAP